MPLWVVNGVLDQPAIHSRSGARRKKKDAAYSTHLSIVANQLVFATFCAESYLGEEERLSTVIYGLLFCHVLTYCCSYIKEIYTRRDWDLSVRIGPTSNVKHFALTSINVGLEWTKLVTFLITIVSFLLVLGAGEGFRFLEAPSLKFLILTLSYYGVTEPRVRANIPNLLLYLPSTAESVEGLETLYAEILLKGGGMALSGWVLFPLLPRRHWVTLGIFLNIYRPSKALRGALHRLQTELNSVKDFREANDTELKDYEDVCTICLGGMRSARITPCQHYFHTNCLRLYLKTGFTCPICKRYLY